MNSGDVRGCSQLKPAGINPEALYPHGTLLGGRIASTRRFSLQRHTTPAPAESKLGHEARASIVRNTPKPAALPTYTNGTAVRTESPRPKAADPHDSATAHNCLAGGYDRRSPGRRSCSNSPSCGSAT